MSRSPALGIGWLLWRRGGLAGIAAALNMSLMLWLVPLGSPSTVRLACMLVLGIPLVLAGAHLLTILTFGPTNFGKRGSGFPMYMLVLPMRTASLAAWPMVYGTGAVIGLYALIYVLVILPRGMSPAFLTMGGMLVSGLAWIQALAWFPFAAPFLRGVLTVVVITVVCLITAWSGIMGESPLWKLVVHSFITLLAYATAIIGLRLARRGDDLALAIPAIQARWPNFQRGIRRPFRSAAAAQFWYEFRRNSIYLPLMVGVSALALFFPAIQGESNGVMLANMVVSSELIVIAAAIAGPVFGTGAFGAAMGKFEIWSDEVPTFTSFFATRPLATSDFVIAKLKSAAAATLLTWAIVVAFITGVLALAPPAAPEVMPGSIGMLDVLPSAWIAVPLIVLLLMFITWRNIASGMAATLCGRPSVAHASSALFMAMLAAGAFAVYWGWHHPQHIALVGRSMVFLLWIVAAVKLALMLVVSTMLRRASIISHTTIQKMWMAWLLGCVLLWCVGRLIAAPSLPLLPLTLLLMPFNRIGLSFLALRWNRHR